MKKYFLLLFSLLVFIGTIVSSFYFDDRIAPEIEIKETPKLTCECGYSDLINFAEAKDSNLKSFFIENNDKEEIIRTKSITYVAIDQANNVSKLKTRIDISDELKERTIVNKQELRIQKSSNFDVNDYFELQNGCGNRVDDKLEITDFNINANGLYNAQVISMLSSVSPLNVTIEVIDEHAPKISLKKEEIYYYVNTFWSDNDFLSIIETLEDDIDSKEDLLEQIMINWRDAMKADENGLVTDPGKYEVTYIVKDSDGNVTKTSVFVILQ